MIWRYNHPEKHFPFYSSPAVTDKIVVIGGRDKLIHALDPKTGETLWTFSTRARVDASPVISGDLVYAVSGNGDLFALALEDGSERWRFEIAAPVTASPAIGEGYLVLGNDDGVVLAFGKKNSGPARQGSP